MVKRSVGRKERCGAEKSLDSPGQSETHVSVPQTGAVSSLWRPSVGLDHVSGGGPLGERKDMSVPTVWAHGRATGATRNAVQQIRAHRGLRDVSQGKFS